MQKVKSTLIKLLVALVSLCCVLGMTFGLVGCGDSVKGISKTEINAEGQLVITYTDGTTDTLDMTGVSTLKSDCSHNFIDCVVSHASCVKEEVVVKVCSACHGSKVVVGEKNSDVHGVWKWETNADDERVQVLDTSCIKELEKDPEEFAGACPKRQCTLCNQMLAQHEELVEYPVANEDVNPCEDEHLVIVSCKKCHAVVDSVKKEAAKGHDYEVTKKDYNETNDTYTVYLACKNDNCYSAIKATAKYDKDKSVEPTCKEGGTKVYTYTYNNFLEDKTGEFSVDVAKDDNHTIVAGLRAAIGADVNYDAAGLVKKAVEDKKIKILDGAANTCTTSAKAYFVCEVCGESISINLYGEHKYKDPVAATCTADGYSECEDCHRKDYSAEDYAKGHTWAYKDGSFVSTGVKVGTVVLKCTTCKTESNALAVTWKRTELATDCTKKNYDVYELNADVVDTLTGDKTREATTKKEAISIKVENDTPVAHKLNDSLSYKTGEHVHYDAAGLVKKAVEDKKIKILDGETNTCTTSAKAYFVCEVCGESISINLFAEHKYDDPVAATCTADGYSECEVEGCHHRDYPEADYAKGHTWVYKDGSFVSTGVKVGTVVLKCTTCKTESNALAVTWKKTETAKDCSQKNYEVYELNADVIDELTGHETREATTKKEAISIKVESDTLVAHKLNDSLSYKTGDNVHYDAAGLVKKAVEDKKIKILDGAANNCEDSAKAYFVCVDCEESISINLYGEHDVSGQELKTKDATCTEAGYKYRECKVCEAEVKEGDPIPALGHDIKWTVSDATAESAGTCTGACSRCTASLTATGAKTEEVAPTCTADGYVIWTYKYDGKEVAKSDKIKKGDALGHLAVTESTPVILYKDGDTWKAYYFCAQCNQYVPNDIELNAYDDTHANFGPYNVKENITVGSDSYTVYYDNTVKQFVGKKVAK